MNKKLATKKMAMTAMLAGALILSGYQSALAHSSDHGEYDHHGEMHRMVDEVNKEAVEKFLAATMKERRLFAQKRAEMRAVMQAATPDAQLAGKISGEIFDLREDLLKKAKDNGIEVHTALHLLGGGTGGADNRDRPRFCSNMGGHGWR